MDNGRSAHTPFAKGVRLDKSDCPTTPAEIAANTALRQRYMQGVGSLMYLAIGTQPDLLFAVGVLSCYNSNPGKSHFEQLLHVMKYLWTTRNMMLCYSPSSVGTTLSLYSNSDLGGDLDMGHSTTGSATYIGSCLVNWRSRCQDTVAKSTAHAELIAANETGDDGVWYRAFMEELGFGQLQPTTMYLDNQAALSMGNNPVQHSKMRAVAVKYFWL